MQEDINLFILQAHHLHMCMYSNVDEATFSYALHACYCIYTIYYAQSWSHLGLLLAAAVAAFDHLTGEWSSMQQNCFHCFAV